MTSAGDEFGFGHNLNDQEGTGKFNSRLPIVLRENPTSP